MRITKSIERWFEVPNDTDKARLKIKHLSPGDKTAIIDQAFKQEIVYRPDPKNGDNLVPEMTQTTDKRLDRILTIQKSVVDWENMFEDDGKTKLKFNDDNLVRALDEIEGFAVLVKELRDKLAEEISKEEETQRKNSHGSASGRQK